ncbi:DUF429 domain-containing protein [Longimycelium tulufanense]|uniref:DUF429 domain-containing protein n=1 Tax=Longimycelium tulufanense TaxID=907463 RepID=UPI001E5BA07F|nr:DUF429 domain-containing protein [Longimycelium tulufanense]
MDGTRGGWVVAVVAGPRHVRWHVLPTAAEVMAVTTDCAAVGVDIPMGLAEQGARTCDLLAARRLGAARSSVFPAPVRAVLGQPGYAEACEAARAATGKAISRQAWNLVPKIADWERSLSPQDQDRVVEVHPESSFRAMAPAVAFAGKRTTRGIGQRLAALRRFVDSGTVLAGIPPGPGLGDAVDALAAAWSAARWRDGTAEVLGDEVDPRGLRMRIVV